MMRSENEMLRSVKHLLWSYVDGKHEVERCADALELIEKELTSAGVQTLTGMPRNPSPSYDRWVELLAQKDEIEEEVRSRNLDLENKRKQINALIKAVESAEQRAIIRFRYCLGRDWDEVLGEMYMNQEDFLDREETYKRRMYMQHAKALQTMAIVFDRISNQKIS